MARIIVKLASEDQMDRLGVLTVDLQRVGAIYHLITINDMEEGLLMLNGDESSPKLVVADPFGFQPLEGDIVTAEALETIQEADEELEEFEPVGLEYLHVTARGHLVVEVETIGGMSWWSDGESLDDIGVSTAGPPVPVGSLAVAVAALQAIAAHGLKEQPDEADHDNMESAFNNGYDVAAWGRGVIASEALAALHNPAAMVPAADMETARMLLRECVGAIGSGQDQIGQMSGMFDDADGAIASAEHDLEDASRRASAFLRGEPVPDHLPFEGEDEEDDDRPFTAEDFTGLDDEAAGDMGAAVVYITNHEAETKGVSMPLEEVQKLQPGARLELTSYIVVAFKAAGQTDVQPDDVDTTITVRSVENVPPGGDDGWTVTVTVDRRDGKGWDTATEVFREHDPAPRFPFKLAE